ncbi:CDP-diacylglycerol--glycerol-3-phosphate 3-phosphatidyltransferase [hydrothermal vent metagenome]|uniref:CDP-diacylglycerol--glycerol-3-phosphate 3-phosphatidyltransferase n=1 Tax=hydrothermal vent metagenome TaxID=652676 RepID=A0A3B0ZFE4_9ZZZZ
MFTLPTMLTFARIGLIPVFVIVFFLPYEWSHIATALIFGLASITDWVDGYLARKWNQTSAFGAFLDPVADKLMVAVILVLLVQANPTALLAIPAAVIICREIAVSALREWMAEIGEKTHVSVSTMGKYKTTFQMIALFMLLYREDILGLPTMVLGIIMLYIAAALTLWSMIIYIRAAWPILLANNETDE